MLGLTGFHNNSNTCYVNVILQILSHCELFVKESILLQDKYYNNALFSEWIELQKTYWEKNRIITLNPILTHVYPIFEEHSQHDSHEFYLFFLDLIERNMQTNYLMDKYFFGEFANIIDTIPIKNSGLVHERSSSAEKFCILSLDPKDSVDIAIKHWNMSELINNWESNIYKKHRPAKKQIFFNKTPKYLSIHFKIFEYDRNSFKKISKHINFEKNIDISAYCSKNTTNKTKYELFGVIVHQGSYQFGHYVAFILNNNKWFMYNDEIINESSFENVKSQSVYMLFYR